MAANVEQPPSSPPAPKPKEILGDIGIAGGDMRHDGDLNIGGDIRDGMTVESGGSIRVGKGVSASTVSAKGSITVVGSINARGKGRCTCGGSITFHHANGAHIEAQGDVLGAIEIVACDIVTFGAVNCELAHIYGGHICATGGLTCATLGSPNGMATLIEVGIDERLRRLGSTRAPEIVTNRHKIAKVRAELAPLQKREKQLTAPQKELVTTLYYESAELEEQTETLIRDLRRLIGALEPRCKSEITVKDRIHPGTTIRFRDLEFPVTDTLVGPLTISRKLTAHGAQMLINFEKPEDRKPCSFHPYADPQLSALFHAVGKKAA